MIHCGQIEFIQRAQQAQHHQANIMYTSSTVTFQ